MEQVDDKTMQKAMKALEKQKKQYARQNAYLQKNYKRLTISIPRSWEPVLSQVVEENGETVNSMVKRLLKEEFQRHGLDIATEGDEAEEE